jgi:hypothetical protein
MPGSLNPKLLRVSCFAAVSASGFRQFVTCVLKFFNVLPAQPLEFWRRGLMVMVMVMVMAMVMVMVPNDVIRNAQTMVDTNAEGSNS